MTHQNNIDESFKGKQGLERLIAAWVNSWRGFHSAWQHEAAFRQECYLLCLLAPAAFWLGENAVQVAILLMSCLIVLIVELLNSAIEAAIDRIGPERHELSGRAKDIASAAVFLSLAQVVLVWGIFLSNRI